MELLVTFINGTYPTTIRSELDHLIETPDDIPRILAGLIDHLLDKNIISPSNLTDIFNTYRTYAKLP
jgi:hypothetical protein